MAVLRTCAALSVVCFCLPAQEATGPTPGRSREKESPVVVSMTFPGGTLAQFVAAVRGAEPNANIVMATRAAEARVPPLELRGAGLEQALESACMVVEGPVEVRVKDSGGQGQPVYTILAMERRQPGVVGTPSADQVVQRVFTLNNLTMPRGSGLGVEPLAVETILSAVELVTTADGRAPLLRFHKDSGLLLVRGTNEQVANASEALAVMANDLDAREQRARRFGGAPDTKTTEPTKATR
ncbi:MAG: hypothetical protein JNM25_09860 [Planctomycetes bacterium]|nr:hypothetical protein [Planctomycetota bacterium]